MKENKGITMVALVVTIIVLIILAGISINMIVGENGIITMAKQAKENTELAEIQERQELDTFIYHTYEEGNKEYTITISNTFEYLQLENLQCLLEIEQWGMTGLKGIDLSNCINLKKIAEPTKHSFDKIVSLDPKPFFQGISTYPALRTENSGFDYAFVGCMSLEEIPDNLFANCLQITSFYATFEGCTALKKIPENWK